MSYQKFKSAEVFQNEQISIDSDVDEEIKITEKRLKNIAKKSVFRKPNMLEDDTQNIDFNTIKHNEEQKVTNNNNGNDIKSKEIERAIK